MDIIQFSNKWEKTDSFINCVQSCPPSPTQTTSAPALFISTSLSHSQSKPLHTPCANSCNPNTCIMQIPGVLSQFPQSHTGVRLLLQVRIRHTDPGIIHTECPLWTIYTAVQCATVERKCSFDPAITHNGCLLWTVYTMYHRVTPAGKHPPRPPPHTQRFCMLYITFTNVSLCDTWWEAHLPPPPPPPTHTEFVCYI